MKKILVICFLSIMLTGCKNEISCTLEKEEEGYKMIQEVVLKVGKDDEVTETSSTITLKFKETSDAEEYYKIFKELNNEMEVEMNGNKLIMKNSEEYSNVQDKNELKGQLEKSGYTCK